MAEIKHVGIIMDGNGRWAKTRTRPRVWGHIRGARKVSDILEAAVDCGVQALTLYAFSTENWSRPLDEVKTLFSLLKKFITRERDRIIKEKVRFRVIGDISNVNEQTKKLILDLERDTSKFNKITLTFAFCYGGRSEIVSSVNNFIKAHPGEMISEKDIAQNLMFPEIGDVDLMIRTGGDQRVSNFLLWQIAYAELFFTSIKWPDFSKSDFKSIFHEVSSRNRRFGTLDDNSSFELSVHTAKVNREIIGELNPLPNTPQTTMG